MTLKGRLQPDHIPANKYEYNVVGLPTITFIEVSGLEQEIEAVDLPDRTMGSGGQVGTTELIVKIPMHHSAEILAMNGWWNDSQDPIAPDYKKESVLAEVSGTGNIRRVWDISGCFPKRRKLPDHSFENEGELAVAEYTLSADNIVLQS
jgi:hypothetical protein